MILENLFLDKQFTNFTRLGDNILLRTVHKHTGKREYHKTKLTPKLYIASKDENAEYQTVYGKPMQLVEMDSPREAKSFYEKYRDVAGFEVCGFSNYDYAFINEHFGMDLEYDSTKIHVMNIDVEVASDDGFPDPELATKEVTAITCETNGVYNVFGCGEFKSPDKTIIYHKAKDEKELLMRFVTFWYSNHPDVITGWNIAVFDVPYLINRIQYLLGEEWVAKLSPWGKVSRREGYNKTTGQEQFVYTILGVSILDYLDLYKKFAGKSLENYKLNTVAFEELEEEKIDYSEYGSLHNLYKEDFQKFIEYNIKDTELISRLDNKLKLIDLVYSIAYSVGINYNDALTTVLLWDVLTHNYLIRDKIVVPYGKSSKMGESIAGGYVKEPIPALYNWEVTVDLESLYPNIIMQYNISPETIRHHYSSKMGSEQYVNDLVYGGVLENGEIRQFGEKHNVAIAASGWSFTREKQGFIPRIMEVFFAKRKEYKNKMLQYESELETLQKTGNADSEEVFRLESKIAQYNNLQTAMKVGILNSGYGYLLNKYALWYDPRLGSSVTITGQTVIKWTEKVINEYLNKAVGTKDVDHVIAIDTDSCMICAEALVKKMLPENTPTNKIVKFLDMAFEQRIIPEIHKSYQHLCDLTNGYKQKMAIKREVIADRGIHKGKKNYILNMHARETTFFAEPELKVMGLKGIKNTTPRVCRDAFKEALKVIMNGKESDIQRFIGQFREKFMTLPFEEIGSPSGANHLTKYSDRASIYRSGCPIQVRAALMYNHMLEKTGDGNKYPKIREGDKIVYCYMRLPNPMHENVIGVPEVLPKSFGLHDFIDYDTQFKKTFLGDVKSILDIIGWEVEKRNKVDVLFS